MDSTQFQAIRQQLNQSPKEFAVTLGKSLRSIQYYETGEQPIPKHVQILALRLMAEKDFQDKTKKIDATLASKA